MALPSQIGSYLGQPEGHPLDAKLTVREMAQMLLLNSSPPARHYDPEKEAEKTRAEFAAKRAADADAAPTRELSRGSKDDNDEDDDDDDDDDDNNDDDDSIKNDGDEEGNNGKGDGKKKRLSREGVMGMANTLNPMKQVEWWIMSGGVMWGGSLAHALWPILSLADTTTTALFRPRMTPLPRTSSPPLHTYTPHPSARALTAVPRPLRSSSV